MPPRLEDELGLEDHEYRVVPVGETDGSRDQEHHEERRPGDTHPGDAPRGGPSCEQGGPARREHDHEIGGAVVVPHGSWAGRIPAGSVPPVPEYTRRVEHHDRRRNHEHDDLGSARALFEDHAGDDPDDQRRPAIATTINACSLAHHVQRSYPNGLCRFPGTTVSRFATGEMTAPSHPQVVQVS